MRGLGREARRSTFAPRFAGRGDDRGGSGCRSRKSRGSLRKVSKQWGDRRFESRLLQRRVCLASAFHAYRRKDPAFARSVSLDVTRERDVLATSRLALAAFL